MENTFYLELDVANWDEKTATLNLEGTMTTVEKRPPTKKQVKKGWRTC